MRMIQYISEYPIKYVTFYGFSTENWNRPEPEINGLFKLVEHFVDEQLDKINEKNIRIRHIGRLNGLPTSLQKSDFACRVIDCQKRRHDTRRRLELRGRAEIIDAIAKFTADPDKPQPLDENIFQPLSLYRRYA